MYRYSIPELGFGVPNCPKNTNKLKRFLRRHHIPKNIVMWIRTLKLGTNFAKISGVDCTIIKVIHNPKT